MPAACVLLLLAFVRAACLLLLLAFVLAACLLLQLVGFCCLLLHAACLFLLPASAEERDMANPLLLLCLLVSSKFKLPCVLP